MRRTVKISITERDLMLAKRKNTNPLEFVLRKLFMPGPRRIEVHSSMAFLTFEDETKKLTYDKALRKFLCTFDLGLEPKCGIFALEEESSDTFV